MKKYSLIFAMLAVVAMLASCGDGSKEAIPTVERTIVYAIDTEMSRAALKTDAEWDELLDRFCSYAAEGRSITFCNAKGATADRQQPKAGRHAGGLSADKPTTITTTSRDEIKSWMKEMEKKGKTVTVTYNEGDGTWNGTAYATAPQPTIGPAHGCYTGVLTLITMPTFYEPQLPGQVWALRVSADTTILLAQSEYLLGWNSGIEITDDEYVSLITTDGTFDLGDTVTFCGLLSSDQDLSGNEVLILDLSSVDESMIVGRWHYTELSTTFVRTDFRYFLCGLSTTDIEAERGSVYFDFRADGTVSYTASGATNSSLEGTWTLSDEGELCCELFDNGGGCWIVSVANSGVMYLSRADFGTEEGDYYYKMVFEKAA